MGIEGLKLAQCAAFVAVADSGSFTKAAKALGVGQSAVSHAIAGLESQLDVALMTRDRNGVELTEVGRRVLRHARTLIQQAELMRHEVNVPRTGFGGELRCGTSQSFAARLLPRLLTAFRAHRPDLRIVLREGTDAQIAEWLRGYAIDVGIVMLPKRDLTTVPLLQDEMYAVLPDGHPLAAGGAVSVAQIAAHPLVMPVGGVEPMVRAVFRAAGREPAVAFRVRDLTALLAMVEEGIGITILPELALPGALPGLRVLPLDPPVVRHLAIGVRTAARHSPAVEAFVATARELAGGGDGNRALGFGAGRDAAAGAR